MMTILETRIPAIRPSLTPTFGLLIACLLGSGAQAITEISSTPETRVTAGLSKAILEDPSIGSAPYNCPDVLEWIDADTAFCPDWTFTGSGALGGNAEECWILGDSGDNLTATSTVAGQMIAIHVAGDANDGVAEIYVDSVLRATLDGYTSPADYAQVIVCDLASTTHSIEVRGTGVSPGAGSGDDVALLGAAVCDVLVEPGTELTCSDCSDNDSDGDTDCLDTDCDGVDGCELGTELTCNDSIDNDGDGDTDCADADCDGVGSCEFGTELTCSDSIDNDADGDTDCADADCDGVGSCESGTELTCSDSIDNDGDGDTDCADADCNGVGSCEFGTELTCNDSIDNDADGNTDCADADCDGALGCPLSAPSIGDHGVAVLVLLMLAVLVSEGRRRAAA